MPTRPSLKAVGTLAQVIFITARDEDREDVIEEATDNLRSYIRLLDELKGIRPVKAALPNEARC
jgi:hypothetical protein